MVSAAPGLWGLVTEEQTGKAASGTQVRVRATLLIPHPDAFALH